MEDEGDQSNGPSDALRRDAGPPPDFELVRPFVASIGVPRIPGQHIRGRRRSLVTADSVDSTQELSAVKVWSPDFAYAPEVALTTRWRAVPLTLIFAIVLITGAAVAYFLSSANNPRNAALPVAPAIAIPAVSPPARTAAASPSPSPSTESRPHNVVRSTRPTPSGPSPSISFAGGVAPVTPSPVPSFSPPPASPVTGQITGIGGLCVDDNGRIPDNGNAIQVYGCNGTPAQDWTFEPDSTVRVLGKCLQMTKPAPGGQAEVWDCDGDTGQSWRRGPSNSLVQISSGLCLEDPGGNQQWGTRLDVAACNGAADEAWTTPI